MEANETPVSEIADVVQFDENIFHVVTLRDGIYSLLRYDRRELDEPQQTRLDTALKKAHEFKAGRGIDLKQFLHSL